MSRRYIDEIKRRVSFPVYQDTALTDVWGQLDGEKDDFIVYDRCGRLAKHIRMPQANMDNSDVEDAIRAVYEESPCGPCTTGPVPQETTPAPVITTAAPPTETPFCAHPPSWQLDGVDHLEKSQGQVAVLQFVFAS
ncbi:selenoprotein Pb-like [Branchiostoma floridae x Branchiostoma japonicum]